MIGLPHLGSIGRRALYGLMKFMHLLGLPGSISDRPDMLPSVRIRTVVTFIKEVTVRRTVTSAILGMAMLLGLASQASAQAVDAGIGWTRLYESNAVSLKFGADYPVMTSGNLQTSAVGEFGLQFFDGATQKALLGGVRFGGAKEAKAKPFGQVLLGGFFCCDVSDFALQFGGGVDLPMNNNKYFIRLQFDIPIDFVEDDTQAGFRFSVGIAFPLKK
jgi:hypothetical protein